jgi:hypothetical protein
VQNYIRQSDSPNKEEKLFSEKQAPETTNTQNKQHAAPKRTQK